MLLRRFKLATVFTQLRRNKIETERTIQFAFVANLWNFLGRSFLACFRFWWKGREAVFVQRPAVFERAIAHLDIVFLTAGKIIEGERIFGAVHHAQIALNAGTNPYARFCRTLGDDRLDQRMCDKRFRDRSRRFRGDNKIKIPHDFLAPAITTRDADLQGVGMGREIIPKRFCLTGDLTKLKRTRMLHPIRDCFAKFFLRRLTKAGQFGDPPGLAGFQELTDRADVKFVVKNFYLFRAEALNRKQLENRTWKLPAKIFQVLQRTAGGEFFDFLPDAFADSGNVLERFLVLQS